MKQGNKRIKLAMVAVLAIVGIIFGASKQSVQAEGYSAPPQQVTFGQTYTGKIYSTQDKYRYNMSLQKAGTVNIAVTLSNPDDRNNYILIEIYNEAGEQLLQELVENSYFEISANLSEGNYYIVADGMMGTHKVTTFGLTPTYKEFPSTSIKQLSNQKGKKLKVKWSKKVTVSGYQIQIATNSKFTKGKKAYTINTATTTSKTITKLKKSKKYYVRVRTYTTTLDGTTAYSAWSGVKNKKITK